MSKTLKETIVLDTGTGLCKIGFAGEDKPRNVFRTVVAAPKSCPTPGVIEEVLVANEALIPQLRYMIVYPIERGIIRNWVHMEKIWHHAFYNELKVDPKEHPVLVTEVILNPKANRERMTQIMFEVFAVPALYVKTQVSLDLLALGKTSGLVVDCGAGVTQVVPICDGFPVIHAIYVFDVAGNEMDSFLCKDLVKLGVPLNIKTDVETIQKAKQSLCFVANDFEVEMNRAVETSELDRSYELSNGDVAFMAQERFRCTEVIFQTSFLGWDLAGLHDKVFASILKCKKEIRAVLFENIVLCGGSSKLQGFAERLKKELVDLALSNCKINIITHENREQLAWLGGSVYGALSHFLHSCIQSSEYDLHGPSMVHRKCL